MARKTTTYLVEIREACDALRAFTEGMNLAAYRASRLVRSAVERELILIGEVIERISQIDPRVGESLVMAGPIVQCYHYLLHPEGPINDDQVFELARSPDLFSLREVVSLLLEELGDSTGET